MHTDESVSHVAPVKAGKGNAAAGDDGQVAQLNVGENGEGEGQITAVVGGEGAPPPDGLPVACAREGETRRQTWERLRREARAVGAT